VPSIVIASIAGNIYVEDYEKLEEGFFTAQDISAVCAPLRRGVCNL